MDSSRRPTDLVKVVEQDLPPEDNQSIMYAFGPGAENGARLHNGRCMDQATKRRTTGKTLLEDLKKDNVVEVCGYCCGDQYGRVNALVRGLGARVDYACDELDPGGFVKTGDIEQVECSTMLLYEAWKPDHVDAWCQWAFRKTSKNIRESVKKAVNWRENGEEPYVMCFNVPSDSPVNWVIGAGDHRIDSKNMTSTSGVIVHGLAPQRLVAPEHDSRTVVEPVPATFTKTHMDLAISLYKTTGERQLFGYGPLKGINLNEAAQVAVETAILALADNTGL